MALLLQGPAPWSIVGSPPVRLEGRTPTSKATVSTMKRRVGRRSRPNRQGMKRSAVSWSLGLSLRRNRFAASGAPSFVFAEFLADLFPDCCSPLNLRSQPDPELEYPLKFLSVVMPTVIVAD